MMPAGGAGVAVMMSERAKEQANVHLIFIFLLFLLCICCGVWV
jgi:hypothetical protein